jgi:hypothetical protein
MLKIMVVSFLDTRLLEHLSSLPHLSTYTDTSVFALFFTVSQRCLIIFQMIKQEDNWGGGEREREREGQSNRE